MRYSHFQHWFYEKRRVWEQAAPAVFSAEKGSYPTLAEQAEAQRAAQANRAGLGLAVHTRIQDQNANLRREIPANANNSWQPNFDVFLEKDFSTTVMGYANTLPEDKRKSYLSWVGMVASEGWKQNHSAQQARDTADSQFYTGQRLSQQDFEAGFKKLYVQNGQVTISGMNELRTLAPKDANTLKDDAKRDAETYKSELEFLKNTRNANVKEAQEVWKKGARSFADHILWRIPINLHDARHTDSEQSVWEAEQKKWNTTLQTDLANVAKGEALSDNQVWNGLQTIGTIRKQKDDAFAKWKKDLQTIGSPLAAKDDPTKADESANDFLNRMEAIYRSFLEEKQKQFQMDVSRQQAGENLQSSNFSQNEYTEASKLREEMKNRYGWQFRDINMVDDYFGNLPAEYHAEVFSLILGFVGHTLNGRQLDMIMNPNAQEDYISQLEKYIKDLETINTRLGNNPATAEITKLDRALAKEKISYFNDQLSNMRRQKSTREETDTGAALHSQLIDNKGGVNINLGLQEMAHTHQEIEQSIFANLAAPTDSTTKAFLVYASEAGGVPSASLHRLLQNFAVYEKGQNPGVANTAQFYGDIAMILKEQNPQRKEFLIRKFTMESTPYFQVFLTATEKENFYNALRTYREVNLEQKASITAESMFEKQYGIKLGVVTVQYLQFYTKSSPEARIALEKDPWDANDPVIIQFLNESVGSTHLLKIPPNQFPAFLTQLRGYLKQRNPTIQNDADALQKLGKEANSDGKLSEAFSAIKDYATNGEFNGTGTTLLLVALLFITKKEKKLLTYTGIAALVGTISGDLYKDIKGENMWNDLERYAWEENISTEDPAGMFMERAEGMDKVWKNEEIDKRDRLFAGVGLKGIDPNTALKWYEMVSISNEPEAVRFKKEPHCSDMQKDPLMKQALSHITPPAGKDAEVYKMKAVYQYLQNFFMHVGVAHKNHPDDPTSISHGFEYIKNTYLEKTEESDLLKSAGKFNMGLIFASEVTLKQEQSVQEGNSQMIADLSEVWGITSGFMTRKFQEFEQKFGIDLMKEGKDLFAAVEKMGYKIWEGAGDELVFWDGTNEATKFVVEKYDNAPWIIKLPFMLTGEGLSIANDVLKASPEVIRSMLEWLKTNAVDSLANYVSDANAKILAADNNIDAFKEALRDHLSKTGIKKAVMQAYGIRSGLSPDQLEKFIGAIVSDETAFFQQVSAIRTSTISKAQAGIKERTFHPTADNVSVAWNNITDSEVMRIIQGGAVSNAVSTLGYVRNVWNVAPEAIGWLLNMIGLNEVGAKTDALKFDATGSFVSMQTSEYVKGITSKLPTIPNIMTALETKDHTNVSLLDKRAKELSDLGITISASQLGNAFAEKLLKDPSFVSTTTPEDELKTFVPEMSKEKAKEIAMTLLATLQEQKTKLVSIQTILEDLYTLIYNRRTKANDAEKNAAGAQLLNADELYRRFLVTHENAHNVFDIWGGATAEQKNSLSLLKTEAEGLYLAIKDRKANIDSVYITP